SGETFIGYSSSGGLSSHCTYEKAFMHATSEVCERDTLNIFWNCFIPPKKINVDAEFSDNRLRTLYKRYGDQLKDVKLYYHKLEDVDFTVVTAIKIDKQLKKYSFLSGGGVGVTVEEAIEGAIGEFAQAENNLKMVLYSPNWITSKGVNFLFNIPKDLDIRDMKLFYQIVPYYGYEENQENLDWYMNDGGEIKLSQIKKKEKALFGEYNKKKNIEKILKSKDIDPIILDFTDRNLNQLKILKVFIPELTPAYISSIPLKGHLRYSKYLNKTGHSEVNPDPIPYP
ncbi:MAG: YcaO-like family protein, partial [Halanaerobiales bacterium]